MHTSNGHSVDDYLVAIYALATHPLATGTAISARVAERLEVSRTAVGLMRKRLVADGLLEPATGRPLVLTPAGRKRAEAALRRDAVVERFLTDYLGYSALEAFDRARYVGGSMTDDMVERLHRQLGTHGRRLAHDGA